MQERTQHGERWRMASDVLWLYALQGLNYLVPLLLLPYLVRVLGVGRYGLMALAQAVAQYFIIATDYGFNFSAARRIALHREDAREVSRIFHGVLAIKLVLVAAGGLALVTAVLLLPTLRREMWLYLAAYVAVVGNALFPVWLFQGMERMRFISMLTGGSRLAAAGLVLWLVRSPNDAALATLLQSLGWLAAGVAGAVFGARHFELERHPLERGHLLELLREGRHLFASNAAVTLYTNTNVLLVGMIGGNVEAGYFSLADRFLRAVTGLAYPVIQAAYPRMVRLVAQSRTQALRFLRRLMTVAALVAAAVGAGILLLAPWLARVAFGQAAVAVVPVIRAAAFFPLAATLSGMIGMLGLIPQGLDRAQSRMLFAAGVLNVAVASVWIHHAGAVGGVLSMLLIECVLTVAGVLLLAREQNGEMRA